MTRPRIKQIIALIIAAIILAIMLVAGIIMAWWTFEFTIAFGGTLARAWTVALLIPVALLAAGVLLIWFASKWLGDDDRQQLERVGFPDRAVDQRNVVHAGRERRRQRDVLREHGPASQQGLLLQGPRVQRDWQLELLEHRERAHTQASGTVASVLTATEPGVS